jgi:hypothetical protein
MRRLLMGVTLALLPLWMSRAESMAEFVDVARQAGIHFQHVSGAQGERLLPETYGSGVAFLDYDADGFLDLYWVNSGTLGDSGFVQVARNALYRNSGDGTFVDRTKACRVGDTGYGMGVAVGDYDGDGDLDMYVTNYGPNVLYRNESGGEGPRFRTVTDAAGVADDGWGTSAAFCDVDEDGYLDLYVANYLDYSLTDHPSCTVDGTNLLIYCDPRQFAPQRDRFFRNLGPAQGWTFEDHIEAAGLAQNVGKELGVIFFDSDLDGDQDLYLACDLTPNLLFLNEDGVFHETGLASGTSLNDEGELEAGMGVDVADVDEDGLPEIFVTNFQWQSNTMYRNLGGGFFLDATAAFGLEGASMPYLGFGTGFIDYDNDGDMDLFVANGHVDGNVEQYDAASRYQQPNQLFENRGDGRFSEVETEGLGPTDVSRGAAFGDYDNDGDMDIAVSNSNGRSHLLRNQGGHNNHWLGMQLRGGRSNRDALGARVTVEFGDRRTHQQVRRARGYLSSSDARLLFGLGSRDAVDSVTIEWPDGTMQILGRTKADRYLLVVHPSDSQAP